MSVNELFELLSFGLDRLDPSTAQEVRKHCYDAGAYEKQGNGPFNPTTFIFDFEAIDKLSYNLRVRPNRSLLLLTI